MEFDFDAITPAVGYKLLTSTILPRPIAWVTSVGADGVVNAAPFSFFNAMGANPPTVALGMVRDGVRGWKDTPRNILDSSEFVVNLVPENMAGAMNATAMALPAGESEIDVAGLQVLASTRIAPPRIAGVPVAFECRAISSVVTGPMQVVVIGRVLAAHIDDAVILDAERGYIDSPALGLIARMHGAGWYARTSDLFQLERP
ncbi:NADH-FMN oxidoreductase RutF, flavin reductase (DIM6/NTAB) family [Pseudorhodobacter antarcticus]|uniref:NADH-FMN oxidoreductase RutF, flavin reductase (DIM6/NTAB) family n=1 Tax=Pseudorhodobacter antarcticus TaxID=1077947 RepID=A0A1H8B7L7_9RHOB|nr:flavin reductase family protein [Pseudorhodobacter antarcticus]SEM78743.1 NADH-FMN oxidoreductase RutF, flavin reductase (DIM6/NTAB) family [Pseudorhodobacter antarcticus]